MLHLNQLETDKFLEIKKTLKTEAIYKAFLAYRKSLLTISRQTSCCGVQRIKGKALSVFVARVIFGVTEKQAHTYPQMMSERKTLAFESIFERK